VAQRTAFSFVGDGGRELTEVRDDSSEATEEEDGKLVTETAGVFCEKIAVAAGSGLTANPHERLRVISPLGVDGKRLGSLEVKRFGMREAVIST
jgi:hypothetical protein